MEVSRLVPSVM